MRVYNFSAGPSQLPLEVLEEAQRQLLSADGSGMSVMEMSHRSKYYEPYHDECIFLLRELMGIPDNYEVLFVQGGGSTQFEAVPLNLFVNGKADYFVTGNFAKKAYQEAQKYGDVAAAASSEDKVFTYIPDVNKVTYRDGIDYVYICSNNTIFGTRFTTLPQTSAELVADMSSGILTERVDVSKFGLIFAGAQKNIGPAGLTIVIIRKDLVDRCMPICPTMLRYSTQAKNNSLYNTPPTFSIYMAMLNLRWLKKQGGVDYIEQLNKQKSGMLYDFVDNSDFYRNNVAKTDRSIVNCPFQTPNAELDAAFCKEAEKEGLLALKGHRLAGGMRASMYNGMPIEGAKKLVDFMKAFELRNK